MNANSIRLIFVIVVIMFVAMAMAAPQMDIVDTANISKCIVKYIVL
jgi:hypothetical protein